MELSDFFIGKPGPGSLSESLVQGLPVIVVHNAWTMPQERYNAQWIRENDFGLVLQSFRSVDQAVAEVLDRLDELRMNIRRAPNRAIFEIPAILAGVLLASDYAAPIRLLESDLAAIGSEASPPRAHMPSA
jgi:hypothetical protein